MALQRCESWDAVSTIVQLFNLRTDVIRDRKWVAYESTYRNQLSFVAGGKTGNMLRCTISAAGNTHGSSNNNPQFYGHAIELVTPTTELVVGRWYRADLVTPADAGETDNVIVLGAKDLTSSDPAVESLIVRVSAAGVLTLYSSNPGAGDVTLATSAGDALLTATWYYIEMRAQWATSGAAVTVRVNENTVISGTYNTKQDAVDANFTWVGFAYYRPASGSRTIDCDDLYICDVTGTRNNGLLGVVSVPVIRPSGNGADTDWLGSDTDSTDNYQLIDEVSTDDTDYIQSSTVGDRDTHTYENITDPGPPVLAVVYQARAGNTGSGRSMKAISREGGDTQLSADLSLDGSLRHKQTVFETQPDGISDWTAVAVNAAEFGVETT